MKIEIVNSKMWSTVFNFCIVARVRTLYKYEEAKIYLRSFKYHIVRIYSSLVGNLSLCNVYNNVFAWNYTPTMIYVLLILPLWNIYLYTGVPGEINITFPWYASVYLTGVLCDAKTWWTLSGYVQCVRRYCRSYDFQA